MPNATCPGRRVLSIFALALVAGACAGPGPVTAPPSGTGTPASDRPGQAAVRVGLETAASGLDAPLWVSGAGDGSGRLFIAEQGGRVRVIRDGALQAAPYVDLTDRVLSGGERGLLGLAFAPGFGAGGETRLYAHYSGHSGETTIVELRATPGADTVDASTERVLLVEPQPYANHNGGWIGFDATGMLLVGLGDGGSGGDPDNRASRLDTILGKMLRLDVLGGPSGALEYGIPSDNPFVGRSGARPEILHYGLRNPFRASVDAATGTLWIGDVGQGTWEEVDAVSQDARGLDFGWRRWEGRHCFNPAEGCDPAGVTMPVAEYEHPAGLQHHRRGRLPRGRDPRASRRIPVLRLLQRDPVGDRRGHVSGRDRESVPGSIRWSNRGSVGGSVGGCVGAGRRGTVSGHGRPADARRPARDRALDQLDRDGRGGRGVPHGPRQGRAAAAGPRRLSGPVRSGRRRSEGRRSGCQRAETKRSPRWPRSTRSGRGGVALARETAMSPGQPSEPRPTCPAWCPGPRCRPYRWHPHASPSPGRSTWRG